MKQTLYLIIGFLFLTCRQPKQLTVFTTPSIPFTPSIPSIKGDWKEVSISPYDKSEEHYRWMSFDDSIGIGNLFLSHRQSYYINHDTLFINRDPQDQYSIAIQFPILKFTNDSLVLLSPYKDGYFQSNRMAMARITQQNTIKPTAIYFASGICYGSCPEVYLKIDSARNFTFFGKVNLKFDKMGGFHGKISEADYAAILTLINKLPVSTLKEKYRGNVDDATQGMAIEWEGKLITCKSYRRSYNAPPELTLLLYKLINVYKNTSLQRDSTVTELYFSQHPAATPTTQLILDSRGRPSW
jgi:hypothetical protein